MGYHGSDLPRTREAERTYGELMAGLDVRVTQPMSYSQTREIVQPALVMLQQEVMTGIRCFHDNASTGVTVSLWVIAMAEFSPRDASMRACSQASTSLCRQRNYDQT